MPRLIDDLRTQGKVQIPRLIAPRWLTAWERYAAKICQYVSTSDDLPVLLIDNVAQYYWVGTKQEYWQLERDFPNLAPPWPVFWVEHHMARTCRSEIGDRDLRDTIGSKAKIGVLVHAFTRDQVYEMGADNRLGDGAHWLLWMELFVNYDASSSRHIQGPHGSCFVQVDAEGRALGPPGMHDYGDHPEHIKNLITLFNPTLLAISFLHCKNVTVEDQSMDKPLAKKYRSQYGREPARWKTLVIEPLKQILRKEGRADTNGLAKAMHICRGHFADYRNGRGLFGKYKQLVWMPMTIRGTKGEKPAKREIEVKV